MTDVLTVDPASPDPERIARAAECLRQGGLVAFPTETVYGLGVHALDASAVLRLFAAKGRPANDPLIVHVVSLAAAAPLVAAIPPVAHALAARFWPGPLTLVLRRSPLVPDEVTAGLETVAIRVPAHPVARALIESAGVPVAAPSANLFSRPSPTRASHVLDDLRGRIDLIVDGGPTPVGVESTVLDLSEGPPTVLRPGAVSEAMLRTVLDGLHAPQGATPTGPLRAPGLLARHYSPRAPLTLFEGPAAAVVERMSRAAVEAAAAGARVGILAADEDRFDLPQARVVRAGPQGDLAGVAARLFAALRELDAAGVDVILARGFSGEEGLGPAVRDRLRRAAAGRVIACS